VEQGSIDIPCHILIMSMESGETYFWNVEGEDLIDTDKSSSCRFSVLSVDKSKEVEGQEAVIRNTFRDEPESSNVHSVLGAYYLNQGLLQDAIHEFRIISAMNAAAPLPHEILGAIYAEAGDKDMAIEELQKALELSRNQDK
jgi:tetratricopeptide (TPR) repeat protein